MNEETKGMSVEDLKKRDYILMVDKSGSMNEPDCGTDGNPKTRWEAMQEITLALARQCEKYDDNGITIVTFNKHSKKFENITSGGDKIKQIFEEEQPGGETYTAEAMDEILQEYLDSKGTPNCKPITVICVTDGEPQDEKKLAKVITDASNKLDDENEIGISFIQVGKDKKARTFLKNLDDHLTDHGAKFDIVSTCTDEDLNDKTMDEVLIEAVTA